jgi:cytochrome c-type biogenesis protein CcmH/NrfF
MVALAFGGLLAAEVKTTDEMTRHIREVGLKLHCTCGCSMTVADCNMLYCHGRDPIVLDMEKMFTAGMTPDAVFSKIVAEYGDTIRVQPLAVGFGAVGWVMPFAALALGLMIAPFVVRRWRQNQLAAEAASPAPAKIDPSAVSRYEAQIEKDLADED